MQAPLRAARSYAGLMKVEVPPELLDLAATAAARTLGQGPMQALEEARGLRLGGLRHAGKTCTRFKAHSFKFQIEVAMRMVYQARLIEGKIVRSLTALESQKTGKVSSSGVALQAPPTLPPRAPGTSPV